jgi:hypothetical protein
MIRRAVCGENKLKQKGTGVSGSWLWGKDKLARGCDVGNSVDGGRHFEELTFQ